MSTKRKSSRATTKSNDIVNGECPNDELSNHSNNRSSESGEENNDENDATSQDPNVEDESGEESNDVSDDDEEDGESSSDEDAEPIVYNVSERGKRATAGNKMAALIASTDQDDDFYKTAYGGFEENNEVDKEFKSPVNSDDDEVDSDFDKEEDEDEPVSGGEDEGRPRRKKRKFNEPKRMTADNILAKNKKWAMARLAGNIVAPNNVDDKTQEAMLKEALKTEKMNVESLKKYEAFELERKKKRERNPIRVFPPGPREQIKMTAERTTVKVSDVKTFKCERPKDRNLCAVTGRPARYRDPVTGLPYSSAYAFKVIRDRYHKHLRTLRGNEEVSSYLSSLKALPTPPISPRVSNASGSLVAATKVHSNLTVTTSSTVRATH